VARLVAAELLTASTEFALAELTLTGTLAALAFTARLLAAFKLLAPLLLMPAAELTESKELIELFEANVADVVVLGILPAELVVTAGLAFFEPPPPPQAARLTRAKATTVRRNNGSNRK
jgi:hypothetical protein